MWSEDDALDKLISGVFTQNPLEYSANEHARLQVLLGLIVAATKNGAPVAVRNTTGSTITAPATVYKSGYDSTNSAFLVAPADATDKTKAPQLVLTSDLANNANGNAYVKQAATGIDTSAASAVGAPVYLDASTPGAWTLTAPALPARAIKIGTVTAKDAVSGSIAFFIRNPFVALLADLADVDLSGLADSFTLQWSAAGNKWIVAANATTDEKIKTDNADPTAGHLDAKVDGSTVEVNATAHQLRVKDAGITYAKIQNVSATDKLLGRASSGAGVVEEIACTAAGRALLDDADAAAQRATLGVNAGTSLVSLSGDVSAAAPDANKVFANLNATLRTVTLPAPAAGLGPIKGYCGHTDGIRFVGPTGARLRVGSTVTTADTGHVDSVAVGSYIEWYAIDGTNWVGCAAGSGWTVTAS